jgi:hypothetical protein
MAFNLTSEQWYDLGHEMGHVSQIDSYLDAIFKCRYGVSHRYSRLCQGLWHKLVILRRQLDEIIYSEHSAIRSPDGECIQARDVFHVINTDPCDDLKYEEPVNYQLVHSLPKETKDIINHSTRFVKDYVNKLNTMFFNNKNKDVRKILNLMDKLEEIVKGSIVFV